MSKSDAELITESVESNFAYYPDVVLKEIKAHGLDGYIATQKNAFEMEVFENYWRKQK